MPVLSVHVVVDQTTLAGGTGPILAELGGCLEQHFDVEHSTIQIEPVDMAHDHAVHR